jgi:VWFA-related protein
MVRASAKCIFLAAGSSNSVRRTAMIAMGFRRCVPFLAAVAAVFGQETVPFDSDLVIRSTTNLVQVRVVAEDSQGRPVTDLKQADFQIEDDRKPQPITLFSADRGAQSAPATTSNSANSEEAPPGYAVILLDWLNIKYSYRLKAREQVIGLLKKYQPRQRVAIYILDQDPRLLHDFTTDMSALVQAVDDAGVGFPTVDDDPGGRGRVGGGNTDWQILYWQNEVFDTLHTLEVISGHLAHVPGRKSMVWLSAGFPTMIGGIDFAPRVERALARLNKADVAVYSVNACGLSAACRSYGNPMHELAARTGATTFAASNDLDEGIRLALEDMRISYTLGFNVAEGAALGLHQIRLRTNRPGVQLRYRESYDWAGNSPVR